VLLILTDTWLHLATVSVEVEQLVIQSPTLNAFARHQSPECLKRSAAGFFPCSLEAYFGQVNLVGGVDAYKTLDSLSTTNRVFTVMDDTNTYALLGDASTPTTLDFEASTVAVNTQCRVMSKECNLSNASGSNVPYNCSGQFVGDLALETIPSAVNQEQTWRVNLFNDSALTIPTEVKLIPHAANPVYVAMGACVDSVALIIDPTDTGAIPYNFTFNATWHNSDIVLTDAAALAFLLLCNSTVYDATYQWTNGSFSGFTSLTIANQSTAQIIQGPLQNNATFSTPYFLTGIIDAVFQPTAQAVADKMAVTYSTTAVGLSAGVFIPADNLSEQIRRRQIVSRVPWAPLYAVVATNTFVSMIGLVLGVGAIRRRNLTGITDRLSIWGLLAELLDTTSGDYDLREKLIQEERDERAQVVGVEKVGQDTWRLKVFGDHRISRLH
jgi:hypothetical protein